MGSKFRAFHEHDLAVIFCFWVLLNILIAPAVALDLLYFTRPCAQNIGALHLLYFSGGTLALVYTTWICVLIAIHVSAVAHGYRCESAVADDVCFSFECAFLVLVLRFIVK